MGFAFAQSFALPRVLLCPPSPSFLLSLAAVFISSLVSFVPLNASFSIPPLVATQQNTYAASPTSESSFPCFVDANFASLLSSPFIESRVQSFAFDASSIFPHASVLWTFLFSKGCTKMQLHGVWTEDDTWTCVTTSKPGNALVVENTKIVFLVVGVVCRVWPRQRKEQPMERPHCLSWRRITQCTHRHTQCWEFT